MSAARRLCHLAAAGAHKDSEPLMNWRPMSTAKSGQFAPNLMDSASSTMIAAQIMHGMGW
jgi:hypothetical protein